MIRPSRGYVLVEPEEADEVSAGGVILPERVKDMPQKGKVLAVGQVHITEGVGIPIASINEYLLLNAPCKVGDRVLFKRFVDQRIKEDGKELILVPFQDILGIYES